MAELYRQTKPTPDARQKALEAWLARGGDDQADWPALVPGPRVADVAARLSSAPREFLRPELSLGALAGDVLGDAMHSWLEPQVAEAVRLIESEASEFGTGAALGLWVLASEELVGRLDPPLLHDRADRLLTGLALRLAPVIEPYDWLVSADRREEAARAILRWCGQRPSDEDPDAARSRWDALDSLRRDQALQATMADYLHRQEVLRQLQEERAREAAARYGNE